MTEHQLRVAISGEPRITHAVLETRRLADGVLGQTRRSPKEQDLQFASRDVVLLYTDGVPSHFEVNGLRSRSLNYPVSLACAVVEHFGKLHDDAACIAPRYEA